MTTQPNPQEPVVVTQLTDDEKAQLLNYARWIVCPCCEGESVNYSLAQGCVVCGQDGRILNSTANRIGNLLAWYKEDRIAHAPSQPTAGDALSLLGIDDRPFMEGLSAYLRGADFEQLTFTLDKTGGYEASWSKSAERCAQGFCPTCGKPSDSDCSKCAQWWKDNPPSQHSELADRLADGCSTWRPEELRDFIHAEIIPALRHLPPPQKCSARHNLRHTSQPKA